MEECNEEKIISAIITSVIIFIFISIIVLTMLLKEEQLKETEAIEYLTSTPIEENIEITSTTEQEFLSSKTIEVQELPRTFIENIEEKNNPYVDLINNLTDYERELIYKITFAEAGNQEEEGQRAVIEVILNRVLSNDFPSTIEEVLSQKNQFTTWKIRNKIKQSDQNRIISILELVASEEPILPSLDYLFFAKGKQTKYATDFIKIQDHWFGAIK